MTYTTSRRHIAARGALIALAVAAAIGGVIFGAVMLLGGGVDAALVAVTYVAVGYLCLNLIILVVGLWLKPTEAWAVGAALATPVVLAAIGFGYAAYRSVPS